MDFTKWMLICICMICISTKTNGREDSCNYQPDEKMELNDDEIKQKIDEFVEAMRECFDVHASSLAVVQDGKPFLSKGYGMTERGGTTPVTNQTMFVIASTSKAMVGALFASLFSDDNVSATFDTPIRDILGDWFYFSEGYRSQQVTVRDLLAHRTGMSFTEDFRLAGVEPGEMPRRIRHFPFRVGFRDQPEVYNNIIYGLSTAVASAVADKQWEEAIQERILSPLGMTSTVPMHFSEGRETEFATSYHNDDDGTPRRVSLEWPQLTYGNVPGMGSNAEDMVQWLIFQATNGQTPAGEQLVDPDQFAETHKGCAYSGTGDARAKPSDPVMHFLGNYACGWREGYYNGFEMSQHAGGNGAYRSLVTRLPALGIGIFSSVAKQEIEGRGGNFNTALHAYIIDLLTGQDPWFSAEDVCPEPEQLKGPTIIEEVVSQLSREQQQRLEEALQADRGDSEAPIASKAMEEYVGVYGHFGYGNMTVTLDGEDLMLAYGPKARWILSPVIGGSDIMTLEGLEPFWYWSFVIEFRRDGDGQVESLVRWDLPNTVYQRDLDWSTPPPPPQLCD